VYLVSTANRDTRKPNMASLADRSAMMDARLSEADCAGRVRRYRVRERQALDYPGRRVVCEELKREVAKELGAGAPNGSSRAPGGGGGAPGGGGGAPGGGGGGARRVCIYQLLGQDSFEDTLHVFSDPRRLETMRGWTILLFPRTTAPSPIVQPHETLRKAADCDVHFEVALAYRDPTPELSSTRMRKALADAAAHHAAAKAEAEAEAKAEAERSGGGGASDKALPGPPEGIHRTVWEAALSRGVYAPLAPSARCLHATIIGAPGSGKTTLGSELVRRLGHGSLRHLSGGDFHRAATVELGAEGYQDGKQLNAICCGDKYVYDNMLTRFIYQCHVQALRQLHRMGLRCFLSDLKEVEQLYMLEKGHLCAFEGREGVSVAYDVVFEIVCSEETIRKRIEGRAKRVGDWKSEVERLDTHLKGRGVYRGNRNEKLAEYAALRSRTQVVALDGEKGVAAICDQMEEALRAVASAKGIALPPPADEEATRPGGGREAGSREAGGSGAVRATVQAAIRGVLDPVFLRHVIRTTWREGGFGQIVATSPRGGSGGKGAGLGGRGGFGGKGGGGEGKGGGGQGKGGDGYGKGGRGEGKGGGGGGKGGGGSGRGKGGRGSGEPGSRGGAHSGGGKGGAAPGAPGGEAPFQDAFLRGKGGGGGAGGRGGSSGGDGRRADTSGSWRR
jgi:adenylate kinase family enzyme